MPARTLAKMAMATDSPKMKVAISVTGVARHRVGVPQCGQRMAERSTSRWHPMQTAINMVACSPYFGIALSLMQEPRHQA
jgi:hypothetical protein